MQLLFDLLVVFGVEAFGTEGEHQHGEVLQALLDCLDLSNNSLQTVAVAAEVPSSSFCCLLLFCVCCCPFLKHSAAAAAAPLAPQGFTKLLLTRRLRDATILQQLLLLYFHPATEGSSRLRQALSVFFPAFSFLAADNQALVRTKHTIFLLSFLNSGHHCVP